VSEDEGEAKAIKKKTNKKNQEKQTNIFVAVSRVVLLTLS